MIIASAAPQPQMMSNSSNATSTFIGGSNNSTFILPLVVSNGSSI